MALSTFLKRVVLAATLAVLLMPTFNLAAGEKVSSRASTSQFERGPHTTGIGLVNLVERGGDHRSDVYFKAIDLITALESAPSCNQQATATLLKACSALERDSIPAKGTTVGHAIALDGVKSTYAARLAICELNGAGAAGPANCSRIVAPRPSRPSRGLTYFMGRAPQRQEVDTELNDDTISAEDLSRCLRSLASRPQWWTSYSNARQNAVVMCQAVRAETEREELLALHKSMVGVSSDAAYALEHAVQSSQAHLNEQMTFAEASLALQKTIFRELEVAGGEIVRFLSNITFAGQATRVGLEVVSRDIHLMSGATRQIHGAMAEVVDQAIQGTSDLALTQKAAWQNTNTLVLQAQDKLEMLSNNQLAQLMGAVGYVNQALINSTEVAAVNHASYESLAKGFVSLNNAMVHLQQQAKAATAAQIAEIEGHQRIRQNYTTDVKVILGALGQVSGTVVKLQSSLDETSKKLKGLGSLGSLFLLFPGLFLIVAVSFVHRQLAGYLGIAVFGCIALRHLELPTLLDASALTLGSDKLKYLALAFATLLLGLTVGIAIGFVVRPKRFSRREASISDDDAVLPEHEKASR